VSSVSATNTAHVNTNMGVVSTPTTVIHSEKIDIDIDSSIDSSQFNDTAVEIVKVNIITVNLNFDDKKAVLVLNNSNNSNGDHNNNNNNNNNNKADHHSANSDANNEIVTEKRNDTDNTQSQSQAHNLIMSPVVQHSDDHKLSSLQSQSTHNQNQNDLLIQSTTTKEKTHQNVNMNTADSKNDELADNTHLDDTSSIQGVVNAKGMYIYIIHHTST